MSQEEQRDKSQREEHTEGWGLWTIFGCKEWLERWPARGCWCAVAGEFGLRGHPAGLPQDGSTLPTDRGSEWLWAPNSDIGIWQRACVLDLAGK